MFGKKKNNIPATPDIKVLTIPMDFYGGINPAIKFKKVEKTVKVDSNNQVLTRAEKVMVDRDTAVGGQKQWHPANLLAKRKNLFIGIGVLFLLAVLGGAGYYYWQWRAVTVATQTPPAPLLTENPPETNNLIVPQVEVSTTTESAVGTTSTAPITSLNNVPLDFPAMTLGDSVNLDKNGLTDQAEEVFQTDPAVPDTDGDKYSDGVELFNLYNPAGVAPVKIIDSGLVKDYINPSFGYQVYYPANWALGNVDIDNRDVLFSTLNGENIEIRVFDLAAGQDFASWISQWAVQQKFSDLLTFDTAFKEKGLRRSDKLVYYFADQSKVYVMIYHPTVNSSVVNYRAVINMMARSFRLQGNAVPLTIPTEENNGLINTPVTTVTSSPTSSLTSTTTL